MTAASAWSGIANEQSGLALVEVLRERVADLGRELLDGAVRLEHLLRAVAALVHRLEVAQAKLGRHGVDVGHRVDAVLNVHHVRVVEAAGDLDDRVDLADVRQELVAEALALVRAAHQPRDVDEVDGRRDDPVRVDHAVELLEARVGHVDHPDVRFDRAEGIVRRLGLGRGQRVEERRLAHVPKADDADRKGHEINDGY